jgi:hypothetical protein
MKPRGVTLDARVAEAVEEIPRWQALIRALAEEHGVQASRLNRTRGRPYFAVSFPQGEEEEWTEDRADRAAADLKEAAESLLLATLREDDARVLQEA